MFLNIAASVVLYRTPVSQVDRLYQCVLSSEVPIDLTFVDNSPEQCIEPSRYPKARYRFLNKNVGFGTGHNLTLTKSIEHGVTYHVILNPDISFPPDTIRVLADYMHAHPDVGLVMPEVRYPSGEMQYLCKLLPSPMDLFGRRFLNQIAPNYVLSRDRRLEMRSSGYSAELNVPWLSGCFMFLRVQTILAVGMFDPGYFMYAEDIDLSRRIHAKYRTMYFPAVSIVHDHAKESFRSHKMLWIHIKSVIRYFNKWGWFVDSERKRLNSVATAQLRDLGTSSGTQNGAR